MSRASSDVSSAMQTDQAADLEPLSRTPVKRRLSQKLVTMTLAWCMNFLNRIVFTPMSLAVKDLTVIALPLLAGMATEQVIQQR